jgi:hypothetical protein
MVIPTHCDRSSARSGKSPRGKGARVLTRSTLLEVVDLAPTFGLNEGEAMRGLLRLYQAHVREFDAFVAKIIDRSGSGRQMAVTELTPAATVAAVG